MDGRSDDYCEKMIIPCNLTVGTDIAIDGGWVSGVPGVPGDFPTKSP